MSASTDSPATSAKRHVSRKAKAGTLIFDTHLARLLGTACATMIDPKDTTPFTPLLPQAVAGALEPGRALVPRQKVASQYRADLLAGGSDLKSVMDRMGHAQITTTQKYLHTFPDADQKNITALDRIRGSPRGKSSEPSG
jgi:integrase